MRRQQLTPWKSLIFALSFAICASLWFFWPESPHDLRIEGIRVTTRDKSDEPGLGPGPFQLVAKIELRTSVDLGSLSHNFVYDSIFVRYYLCRSKMEISQGSNQIYNKYDLLPVMPPFMGRICSGYAPDWGVLQTPSV